MRTLLVLGLVVGLTLTLSARGARYVAPPTGRLMLNEVLPATAVGAGTRLPLYLEKTGRYYAELYIEPTAATQPGVTQATPLSFRFVFKRRDKVLRDDAVDVVLAPGESHKTLFWLESPGHLPARQELELQVSLRDVPPTLADRDLRLQITRKFEMRPIAPR